jgi:hypothetical protein
MPISSLTYDTPVRRSARPSNPDYDRLEAAVALHDEGRPLESLTKVFEHLFPNETLPDLAKETFSFTQGSSRVSTRIEDDHVSITVPLVRLPTGGSAVAALRHVLTRISSSGQLYQPRLRGDDIHLEFRDRLTRMHPAKVLEVLRRMPVEADDTDDWLIGQFGALPLERAPIADLDDAEAKRSEAIWQKHWNDVEELLRECQRKRSLFFLNELTAYALHRLAFVLPLTGFLTSRIDENASTFNDCDEDPLKRESSLAKCVKEMRAVSAEELRKSLGHATYAISPHNDGTPAVLSNYIGPGNYIDTIDKLRSSGKPMDAALALVSTYNFLLARFSWPEEMEKDLKAGLEEASGKSWKEIATVLFEHAKSLAEKYEDEEEEEEEEDEDDEDEDEDEDDEAEDEAEDDEDDDDDDDDEDEDEDDEDDE